MPRIDGLSTWFTVGLVAGVVLAFLRRGTTTGNKMPFDGK